MGLDVGEVRIGVALSDETGLIARGLKTLQRESWHKDLQALAETVTECGVGEIVVGNPINMDGTVGPQSERIRDFVHRLGEVTTVPIRLWDERSSSSSAERVLIEGGMQRSKRKQLIDKLAAVIILQNYLDYQNAGRTGSAMNQDET
jgi:putative holliday junction resolvase